MLTLDEHLACSGCEYDLHGIPEVRCPECGFRYGAAALKSIAADAEWLRKATAYEIIMRAVIGGGLILPAAIVGLLDSDGCFLIAVVFGQILTWGFVAIVGRLLELVPIRFILLALVIWFAGVFSDVFRMMMGVAGLVFLVSAWDLRLRGWPRLAPESNCRYPLLRQDAIRTGHAGLAALIAASLISIFALPW